MLTVPTVAIARAYVPNSSGVRMCAKTTKKTKEETWAPPVSTAAQKVAFAADCVM